MGRISPPSAHRPPRAWSARLLSPRLPHGLTCGPFPSSSHARDNSGILCRVGPVRQVLLPLLGAAAAVFQIPEQLHANPKGAPTNSTVNAASYGILSESARSLLLARNRLHVGLGPLLLFPPVHRDRLLGCWGPARSPLPESTDSSAG